jgi:hypothetical protein
MGKLLFFFPVGIPTADADAIPGMKQDDESSASVGCADWLRRAAVGKVSDDGAAETLWVAALTDCGTRHTGMD